jgi:uncharacterized protein (TIGR02466 family)
MKELDLSTLRICWGTPIVEIENPVHNSIKPGLVRSCYDRCDRDGVAVASGVAPLAKRGLYESRFDFFQETEPAVRSLKAFCSEALLAALTQLEQQLESDALANQNAQVDIHESWVHITKDGGFHEQHLDANCSWFGMYYVDAGDSSIDPPNGVNQFFPPFANTYEDLGTKIWPLGTVTIGPGEGRLVLFPSYVRHSASGYRGQKDRIVIPFNPVDYDLLDIVAGEVLLLVLDVLT